MNGSGEDLVMGSAPAGRVFSAVVLTGIKPGRGDSSLFKGLFGG